MIEVEGIRKTFALSRSQRREADSALQAGRIAAVDGISFTCRPGRIFSLLGPNGAGKTTTLRLIATMLRPDSGTITVAGLDTQKQSHRVREKIGFLTGSSGLYARLTPGELVRYHADLHGMEPALFEKRRKELFGLLGINEFASRRIGNLSSGMKQKVSIARTMIHDPEIVVFDEPTLGLDVITARHIMELIRDCRSRGKTVIFSSHIMGEVSLLSDDLAIIKRGKLVFNDTYAGFLSRMQSRSLEDEFIRLASGD